ncbi:hypothetical protein BLNAU_812 [Blattamonas nauphoetae]|uniref:Uncharacterized protein n=1 Tax=Blattamonas nauphoetae TaxID=2049346 RepID=A0ABQ9YKU8_9EUKA|nr:hypothetical protein BLNAU_812 [Blattamonas nauphoetae]
MMLTKQIQETGETGSELDSENHPESSFTVPNPTTSPATAPPRKRKPRVQFMDQRQFEQIQPIQIINYVHPTIPQPLSYHPTIPQPLSYHPTIPQPLSYHPTIPQPLSYHPTIPQPLSYHSNLYSNYGVFSEPDEQAYITVKPKTTKRRRPISEAQRESPESEQSTICERQQDVTELLEDCKDVLHLLKDTIQRKQAQRQRVNQDPTPSFEQYDRIEEQIHSEMRQQMHTFRTTQTENINRWTNQPQTQEHQMIPQLIQPVTPLQNEQMVLNSHNHNQNRPYPFYDFSTRIQPNYSQFETVSPRPQTTRSESDLSRSSSNQTKHSTADSNRHATTKPKDTLQLNPTPSESVSFSSQFTLQQSPCVNEQPKQPQQSSQTKQNRVAQRLLHRLVSQREHLKVQESIQDNSPASPTQRPSTNEETPRFQTLEDYFVTMTDRTVESEQIVKVEEPMMVQSQQVQQSPHSQLNTLDEVTIQECDDVYSEETQSQFQSDNQAPRRFVPSREYLPNLQTLSSIPLHLLKQNLEHHQNQSTTNQNRTVHRFIPRKSSPFQSQTLSVPLVTKTGLSPSSSYLSSTPYSQLKPTWSSERPISVEKPNSPDIQQYPVTTETVPSIDQTTTHIQESITPGLSPSLFQKRFEHHQHKTRMDILVQRRLRNDPEMKELAERQEEIESAYLKQHSTHIQHTLRKQLRLMEFSDLSELVGDSPGDNSNPYTSSELDQMGISQHFEIERLAFEKRQEFALLLKKEEKWLRQQQRQLDKLKTKSTSEDSNTKRNHTKRSSHHRHEEDPSHHRHEEDLQTNDQLGASLTKQSVFIDASDTDDWHDTQTLRKPSGFRMTQRTQTPDESSSKRETSNNHHHNEDLQTNDYLGASQTKQSMFIDTSDTDDWHDTQTLRKPSGLRMTHRAPTPEESSSRRETSHNRYSEGSSTRGSSSAQPSLSSSRASTISSSARSVRKRPISSVWSSRTSFTSSLETTLSSLGSLHIPDPLLEELKEQDALLNDLEREFKRERKELARLKKEEKKYQRIRHVEEIKNGLKLKTDKADELRSELEAMKKEKESLLAKVKEFERTQDSRKEEPIPDGREKRRTIIKQKMLQNDTDSSITSLNSKLRRKSTPRAQTPTEEKITRQSDEKDSETKSEWKDSEDLSKTRNTQFRDESEEAKSAKQLKERESETEENTQFRDESDPSEKNIKQTADSSSESVEQTQWRDESDDPPQTNRKLESSSESQQTQFEDSDDIHHQTTWKGDKNGRKETTKTSQPSSSSDTHPADKVDHSEPTQADHYSSDFDSFEDTADDSSPKQETKRVEDEYSDDFMSLENTIKTTKQDTSPQTSNPMYSNLLSLSDSDDHPFKMDESSSVDSDDSISF